ncbi:MAG: endonuclease/exonuclease/phosphatase family protein [Caldilineaceae bacterium]|nr:endonuclease/exonuclease/phosphatase family protein [Caldilineaceae bacterium]
MIRVLTYNIHGWLTADGRPNGQAVTEVIAATQADIIGLNEVFYPRVMAGDTRPALEALASELGMHFVFGPCLRWPAQDQMPADAYGNALLSRWPIVASAAHHLTPKEEDQQQLLAQKEQRGLLEGRILLPSNETLTVYVTHLDHTDEAARLLQLRVARQWLGRDRSRPHLVLGDFNAITMWDFAHRPADYEQLAHHEKGYNLTGAGKGPSVIAQIEKAGYTDLYQHFSVPGQQSFLPAIDTAIRIDYIFASQALVPLARSCAIWQEPAGTEASDHRPVLADLAL